jgi:putative redox protein
MDMGDDTLRSVQFERTADSKYEVRNIRGGTLSVGTGRDADFTPVELLLAALGTCSAIDVDIVTSRRADPTEFTAVVRGDKIRDAAEGNRMENLAVEFTIRFPEGEDGDKAREALPRAVKMSHDRLCTVSRTVELGTPVSTTLADNL